MHRSERTAWEHPVRSNIPLKRACFTPGPTTFDTTDIRNVFDAHLRNKNLAFIIIGGTS